MELLLKRGASLDLPEITPEGKEVYPTEIARDNSNLLKVLARRDANRKISYNWKKYIRPKMITFSLLLLSKLFISLIFSSSSSSWDDVRTSPSLLPLSDNHTNWVFMTFAKWFSQKGRDGFEFSRHNWIFNVDIQKCFIFALKFIFWVQNFWIWIFVLKLWFLDF